jgi:hypothetical protein
MLHIHSHFPAGHHVVGLQHVTVHSARCQHVRAGPGQSQASRIAHIVVGDSVTTSIQWVEAHEGTPGNERADVLAGQAAEKRGTFRCLDEAPDFALLQQEQSGMEL